MLVWIAARLPRWIMPDHCSLLGLLSAAWIGVAYALSVRDAAWLWGASAGLLLHWLGDSLDGTLARVRHIERPRYGFYVDHLGDAIATVAIGLGMTGMLLRRIIRNVRHLARLEPANVVKEPPEQG